MTQKNKSPVIYVIHLNNHLKSREIASFDFCRIGQGLVTCSAIGCLCSLWVVWQVFGELQWLWAGHSGQLIYLVSFPTQQHHTVETVIRPVIISFFSDVQWLDVGILMLQSLEPSQTKERPRAILGRLQVSARPPSKYELFSIWMKFFWTYLLQLWRVVCNWGLFATSRKQDKSQQVTVLQRHWGRTQ